MRIKLLFLACVLFLWLDSSHAQETVPFHTWEVYIEHDIEVDGTDRLHFVDLLLGNVTTLDVNGERYTPINDTILFFDRTNRAVMTAYPDERLVPHPFVSLGAARRVDWVVSADERQIVWTLTYDDASGLTTISTVASSIGTNQNLILSDGPRTDGARALPVAFTQDNSAIMFDSQPDGIGDLAPYQQYANLFQLSLVTGEITPMPGEPSCFCAAALWAGQLLRLDVTASFNGFDIQRFDLRVDTINTIPAAGNYTQGGNILISPDGTRAAYALSQLNTDNSAVSSVLMYVDLVTMTQTQLSTPLTAYLTPIQWTEDNTSILFTIPDRDGTWKVNRNSQAPVQVSTLSYVGVIEN